MKTNELIATLSADAGRRAAAPDRVLMLAVGAALLATLVVFEALIGTVRADLLAAAESPRFLIKLAMTMSLAAAALVMVRAESHPGTAGRRRAALALLAPVLVGLGGIAFELATLPADQVLPSLVGTNSIACLIYVPLLGLAPLALTVLALRHAAPVRPGLAGAAAGLLSGALAATAYAAYCPDDSPLFVATWYTIGIAGLAIAGALAGRTFARW